jgi:hypothetical protein
VAQKGNEMDEKMKQAIGLILMLDNRGEFWATGETVRLAPKTRAQLLEAVGIKLDLCIAERIIAHWYGSEPDVEGAIKDETACKFYEGKAVVHENGKVWFAMPSSRWATAEEHIAFARWLLDK